ncbi:hypothetical protein ACFR99_01230 [Haloarchaeobius amylolyticus]|uniref:Restriction endonuclease n=1 Tax=Haloarchaeobius amylolyticus TaxID=1198296 RepID=A0ABD6BBX9_9EURY
MDSATVTAAVSELLGVVEDFLNELANRDLPPDQLGEIIEDDGEFEGADLRQFPERFVEDHLIWPVLDVLGYAVTPRPDSPGRSREEYPDFRVDNLPASVIGENKSVNDIESAKIELLDYLDNTRHEYGIATDGFQWGVYEISESDGRDLALEAVVEPQSLKPVVQYLAREERMVPYADLNGLPEPDGPLATFFQNLGHHHVRRATGGLSDFHDLYVEILVGEGDYDHEGIDTPLVEAIDAPANAGEAEKTAFAALLLDRLAFVRLMRDRGVLELELHEVWSHHNRGLNRFQGSFYDTHLKPLFYDVLSEPKGEREEDGFGSPPHFAGGLFEPVLDDEQEYDVDDDVMQEVLTVFIEGEARTVINESARGSLLESYRATDETDLAGQMAEWYADLTRAYVAEINYVEENIEPTLRGFSGT